MWRRFGGERAGAVRGKVSSLPREGDLRGLVRVDKGLKAIAYGFAIMQGNNDHEKVRLETPMYDALYAWCQAQAAAGQ